MFAYEDLIGHDVLRTDIMLASACRCSDLTGAKRARACDREYVLACSSTLNWLELGSPETAIDYRDTEVAADVAKLDAALVDACLEMDATPREKIVIDLDATDDPVHGKQKGREHHDGVDAPSRRHRDLPRWYGSLSTI